MSRMSKMSKNDVQDVQDDVQDVQEKELFRDFLRNQNVLMIGMIKSPFFDLVNHFIILYLVLLLMLYRFSLKMKGEESLCITFTMDRNARPQK